MNPRELEKKITHWKKHPHAAADDRTGIAGDLELDRRRSQTEIERKSHRKSLWGLRRNRTGDWPAKSPKLERERIEH